MGRGQSTRLRVTLRSRIQIPGYSVRVFFFFFFLSLFPDAVSEADMQEGWVPDEWESRARFRSYDRRRVDTPAPSDALPPSPTTAPCLLSPSPTPIRSRPPARAVRPACPVSAGWAYTQKLDLPVIFLSRGKHCGASVRGRIRRGSWKEERKNDGLGTSIVCVCADAASECDSSFDICNTARPR